MCSSFHAVDDVTKPRKAKVKKKANPRVEAISRRNFVEFAGAAAGTAMVGCGTLGIAASALGEGGASGTIVKAKIHPAIGVVRLGNSVADDGFFIGPEVTTPVQTTAAMLRDASGALKRQAARFRIYGLDADDQVVAELTPDGSAAIVDIHWSVHLANKKAAGYRFSTALDIPESATLALPRRNSGVKGKARRALVIDPGVRTISGRNQHGVAYQCDSGTFMGTRVYLGELRTDQAGRLLVLGGRGVSASPTGSPIFNISDFDTFNNADGWYDDTSDGPVSAKVTIDGREIPVESAWVIVNPPNFAPGIIGWRTLYDLLYETQVAAGTLPAPQTTSFTNDILPLLQRLAGLQWVNAGFAAAFHHGGDSGLHFDDPQLIAKLAQKPAPGTVDQHAELRNSIGLAFRLVDGPDLPPKPWPSKGWPWLYGDNYGSTQHSPREHFVVSDLRSQHLQRWMEGDFAADWVPGGSAVTSLDQVLLQDQPAMLDRAALQYCLADAFHPGCELTWPMRHASVFRSPFRINQAPESRVEVDYGDLLTPEIALGANGPLGAQGPGDLSKWMALPWQGDTAMCRSGYDADPSAKDFNQRYDPYLPTFWPARVPNQVLAASDYQTVMNTHVPRAQRIAAFQRRVSWYHGLPYQGDDPVKTMASMVKSFGSMGVLEARPGIPHDPDFPAVMLVESLPARAAADAQAPGVGGSGDDETVAGTVELSPAGWISPEHQALFRAIRGIK